MRVTQGKMDYARQQEQEYSCQSRKAVLQSGGRDSTKSEAVRQASQRVSQRLTSLPKAALSYIASLKRQRT
jgi:hypothetical protein